MYAILYVSRYQVVLTVTGRRLEGESRTPCSQRPESH